MSIVNTGNKIGQTIAGFRLAIATVVSLSLVSSGTALIFRRNKFTKKVEGKVVSAECDAERCDVEYEYAVGGEVYKGKSVTPPTMKGATAVGVSYAPQQPSESTLKVMPTKTIGLALYGFALLAFCVGLLTYTITREVKGAGTAYAAMSAYRLFKN